jgi:hypothetical protein
VYDPVFSFVQRGSTRPIQGYRAGYRFDADESEVWFIVVHSPVMARLFKRNITLETLSGVLLESEHFRRDHRLSYSSRNYARTSGRDLSHIGDGSLSGLFNELRMVERDGGFVADLFTGRPNQCVGDAPAIVAGNTFYVKLADNRSRIRTTRGLTELIDLTWPLYLCLYPIKPIEKRNASLARSLRTRGIERKCEYERIRNRRRGRVDRLCRGEIQGAHIQPHGKGGDDRADNGIWLCALHHRLTEGKLKGCRKADGSLAVRLVLMT